MTLNRIQKLLFTEYSDFEDHVLLECPFAQTTRDGEGIQQLHIGLTPTKLILARDYLEWKDDPTCKEDPVVGTLELVSMLPVEFVNLSVYRRKTRNTIKARFCNQQVVYFELAASFRREMFWNLWCERMKFLCPEEDKDSAASSEGSVSSSSSSSSCSLNIRSFSGPKAWEERNLYLGNNVKTENEVLIKCPSKQSVSKINEVVNKPAIGKADDIMHVEYKHQMTAAGDCQRVYRFGAGIDENCVTSLYLPANTALVYSDTTGRPKSASGTSDEESTTTCYQMLCLTEEAVRVWERNRDKSTAPSKKHRRSSGLVPSPNHLSGLGRVEITRGGLYSLQMKKCASDVNLAKVSSEVKTELPKRLLVSSVSCDCLYEREREYMEEPPVRRSWRYNKTIGRVLYWTQRVPEHTKPYPSLYKQLRRHLVHINDYRKSLGAKKKKSIWTRIKKQHTRKDILTNLPVKPVRSYNTLRKQLKMDISVSSWDFDSTILAYQLTLLDRDFFLMIPPIELHTMICEKSSINAPNMRLMMDFSDRIANLIVTEIVRLDSLKMRARLIGKYINVADKLHRLHNMHSTHSVLSGLTMPAIHRMTNTWTYMRRHHYSKYKRLHTLLKLYKDVRTPLYCKMFEKFSRTPPYLPSIRCIIYGLIGRLPKASCLSGSKSYNSLTSSLWSKRQRLRMWRTQSAGGSLASETTKNTISSESGEFSNVESYMHPLSEGQCEQGLWLEAAKESLKCWQQAATTYDLIESPLVREFLLKAKYLEDTESFFFSQKIEPNENPKNMNYNFLQMMGTMNGTSVKTNYTGQRSDV